MASIMPNLMLSSMFVMRPKVQDREPPVRGADQVSRVRIRVEEARVQQLLQVADHADVDQVPDVVRGGLRELLAVEPLGRDHLARVYSAVRARAPQPAAESSLMDAANLVAFSPSLT